MLLLAVWLIVSFVSPLFGCKNSSPTGVALCFCSSSAVHLAALCALAAPIVHRAPLPHCSLAAPIVHRADRVRHPFGRPREARRGRGIGQRATHNGAEWRDKQCAQRCRDAAGPDAAVTTTAPEANASTDASQRRTTTERSAANRSGCVRMLMRCVVCVMHVRSLPLLSPARLRHRRRSFFPCAGLLLLVAPRANNHARTQP